MSSGTKDVQDLSAPAGGSRRWKQFLMIWVVIYPLVLFVPMIVNPGLRHLGLPTNRYLDTLAVVTAIVFLMVYLILPLVHRRLGHWLAR